MGRKAKTRRALERRKQKAARKNAMRAQYEKWTAEGRNQKSKRSRLKNKRDVKQKNPRDPLCKNIGDVTQYPALNLPYLAKMYLMKRAGIKHQYTGKHTQVVREFCEKHKLTYVKVKGKPGFIMRDTQNETGHPGGYRITDERLFALAT